MFNKYWEKKGCRRSDDVITAVVTLSVNNKPVYITIEGLAALNALYMKHPDTCIAFNTTRGTGHYMGKSSRALARAMRIRSTTVTKYLSGEKVSDTYTFVAVLDILPALNEIMGSTELESMYRAAMREETIAKAGDLAYKTSWAALWNGRWYSYYNDPNIQKQRVTNAYRSMTYEPTTRPKQRILK